MFVIILFVLQSFLLILNLKSCTSTRKTNIDMQNIVYKDAYIFACDDGNVQFVCNGKTLKYDGALEDKYTGVADIEIKNGKMFGVKSKPDIISGTLSSFTENSVTISTGDVVQLANNDVPIFDISHDSVSEIDFGQLVLGCEKIDLVLENGKVCAIIRKDNPDLTYIRVLLKNKEETVWQQVSTSSNGVLVINGQNASQKSMDVSQYMIDNNLNQIELASSDNYISFNKKTYEGTLIISRFDNGYSVVNKILLEDYVKYVLPSEMPTSYSKEALKAQAVCARTFAYSQMHNATFSMYGANLDDTTSYQVYNASGRSEVSDAAVDETKNEVITCNGELITCYYFSTSGGKTEDMEVWGSDNPEYIKKVESIDDNSAYYRWTSYLDTSQECNPDYGKIVDIVINNKSDSQYILSLSIVFENGTLVYTKENDIRKILGIYQEKVELYDGSNRTNLSMVPSACFNIEKIGDNKYKLSGAGFGHGIGMSQCGADKLAKSGYTYEEIICYYYNNVKVIKRN